MLEEIHDFDIKLFLYDSTDQNLLSMLVLGLKLQISQKGYEIVHI